MGKLLYRLGIWLYYIAARCIAPFNGKSKKFYQGSSRAIEALASRIETFEKRPVWFHCASLGEFEQAKPLIELIYVTFPDTPVVVTFFSPSGFENVGDYKYVSAIGYIPKDTPKNASSFVEMLNPAVAIFIRYEFWYFLMNRLVERSVPVLSVAADFRPSQIFFRKGGEFYLELLKKLSHIFLQNDKSLTLLAEHGIRNATVVGDSRFDRVSAIAEIQKRVPAIENWLDGSKAIVIGSAWPSDMEIIYALIRQKPDYKYIIAPHELDEKLYKDIEQNVQLDVAYFSKETIKSSVLILDTIGLLSSVYIYATFSFVGGGMGPGVHSVLEPAAFGHPVFYGNRNYQRWNEAVALAESNAGFPVGTSQEMVNKITEFETDEGLYKNTCFMARNFIADNAGASRTVLEYVKKLL